MSYMGLDIGTTGCKAVIFDEDGRQLALAYEEYEIISKKDGWAEIDSNQVCKSCFKVIKETASKVKNDPVQGIGISSQGEAFTPIDSKGNILAKAMVSSDTRAASISRTWSREFGREKLYNITGHTPHPMFTIFKLLWLKENQPEVWERADKFLCFEDLLHLKLGLEPAIGWPLAGRTMMFNIKTHQWDTKILDQIGLNKKKLARPLASGTIVGHIPNSIAGQLSLAPDVIIVAGGHDQPCGALGAGVTKQGTAMYATGTVECITPVFSSPVMSSNLYKSNLCTYDYTLDNSYTTAAYSLTGGNILKWFCDQWADKEIREAEERGVDPYQIILEQIGVRPTKLLVLPYWTPSGTPYFDLETPGVIYGLRLNTQKAEVLRALLEGVALEMKLNLNILEESGIVIDELRAIGGGAKSKIWLQLKADILNKPITRVKVTEAGCLGAAMLACAAGQKTKIKDLVNNWVQTDSLIEPNVSNAEYYQEHFLKYKKLYSVLKKIRK